MRGNLPNRSPYTDIEKPQTKNRVWEKLVDEVGESYYHNIITDEVTWEVPLGISDEDVTLLENMSKKVLIQYLRSIQKTVSGTKDELIDRIVMSFESDKMSSLGVNTTNQYVDAGTKNPEESKTAVVKEPPLIPPVPSEIIQCDNCDYQVPVFDGDMPPICEVCGNEVSREKSFYEEDPADFFTRQTKEIDSNKEKQNYYRNLIIGFCFLISWAIILNGGLPSFLTDESVEQDTDGDGLSDTREWDIGTDSTLRDTDGDGLDDYTELNLGTNPLLRDSDFDGYSDLDDNWPMQDWVTTVSWSAWETEDNEICDAYGSKAMRWTVYNSQWEELDVVYGSSGSFNIDMPDDLTSYSLEINLDGYYSNCPYPNEAQLFYGFSCIECSDPGPPGSGVAKYTFTIKPAGTETQNIDGARSGEDWRSEGWLSSSRVTVTSSLGNLGSGR